MKEIKCGGARSDAPETDSGPGCSLGAGNKNWGIGHHPYPHLVFREGFGCCRWSKPSFFLFSLISGV